MCDPCLFFPFLLMSKHIWTFLLVSHELAIRSWLSFLRHHFSCVTSMRRIISGDFFLDYMHFLEDKSYRATFQLLPNYRRHKYTTALGIFSIGLYLIHKSTRHIYDFFEDLRIDMFWIHLLSVIRTAITYQWVSWSLETKLKSHYTQVRCIIHKLKTVAGRARGFIGYMRFWCPILLVMGWFRSSNQGLCTFSTLHNPSKYIHMVWTYTLPKRMDFSNVEHTNTNKLVWDDAQPEPRIYRAKRVQEELDKIMSIISYSFLRQQHPQYKSCQMCRQLLQNNMNFMLKEDHPNNKQESLLF